MNTLATIGALSMASLQTVPVAQTYSAENVKSSTRYFVQHAKEFNGFRSSNYFHAKGYVTNVINIDHGRNGWARISFDMDVEIGTYFGQNAIKIHNDSSGATWIVKPPAFLNLKDRAAVYDYAYEITNRDIIPSMSKKITKKYILTKNTPLAAQDSPSHAIYNHKDLDFSSSWGVTNSGNGYQDLKYTINPEEIKEQIKRKAMEDNHVFVKDIKLKLKSVSYFPTYRITNPPIHLLKSYPQLLIDGKSISNNTKGMSVPLPDHAGQGEEWWHGAIQGAGIALLPAIPALGLGVGAGIAVDMGIVEASVIEESSLLSFLTAESTKEILMGAAETGKEILTEEISDLHSIDKIENNKYTIKNKDNNKILTSNLSIELKNPVKGWATATSLVAGNETHVNLESLEANNLFEYDMTQYTFKDIK